jgi:hypothetical protein
MSNNSTTNEENIDQQSEMLDLLEQYKVWFRSFFLRVYYFINYGEEVKDIKLASKNMSKNEIRAWVLSELIEDLRKFDTNIYVKDKIFENFDEVIDALEIEVNVQIEQEEQYWWYAPIFSVWESFSKSFSSEQSGANSDEFREGIEVRSTSDDDSEASTVDGPELPPFSNY